LANEHARGQHGIPAHQLAHVAEDLIRIFEQPHALDRDFRHGQDQKTISLQSPQDDLGELVDYKRSLALFAFLEGFLSWSNRDRAGHALDGVAQFAHAGETPPRILLHCPQNRRVEMNGEIGNGGIIRVIDACNNAPCPFLVLSISMLLLSR
jgi:hypothetical protein